jgi:hypothetical protein
VVAYYSSINLSSKSQSDLNNIKAFDPTNLPYFFGVALFNFDSTSILLYQQASMK